MPRRENRLLMIYNKEVCSYETVKQFSNNFPPKLLLGSTRLLGSLEYVHRSVQPKPGFGIGNRNQDQGSVSVSGPELFLPKPKLSPILKICQKSFQL